MIYVVIDTNVLVSALLTSNKRQIKTEMCKLFAGNNSFGSLIRW